MKRTRTILPEKERQKVLDRDGDRCQLCGRPGTDFDHAFTLGNHCKQDKEILNQSWNINLLCRRCHYNITFGYEKQDKYNRLQLMLKALERAKIELTEPLYDKFKREYRSKKVTYKYRYDLS